MKNFNYSLLAATLLAGTVVLSSCSSDELPVGNEQPVANELQVAAEPAMTFSFSIPAVMGDEADTRLFNIGESSIDSRFDESEKVYVVIKKDGKMIYANDPLTPSNISADGKKCTLATAGLIFTSRLLGTGSEIYQPVKDDEVYFYYNPSTAKNYLGEDYLFYEFGWWSGTKDLVSQADYCVAEMKVKDVDADNGTLTLCQKEDSTKTSISFKNINSIFRQELTFYNENGEKVTPEIVEFYISSLNYETVHSYELVDVVSSNCYVYSPIIIDYPDLTDGNFYFSLMFNDENKYDDIVFTAIDENYNEYKAVKKAPVGGFENNKYYYGSVPLYHVDQQNEYPQIRGDDGGFTIDYYYDSNDNAVQYNIFYPNNNPSKFSISGHSINCNFPVGDAGMVTLENIVAKTNTPYGLIRAIGIGGQVIVNLKGYNYIELTTDDALAFSSQSSAIEFKCDDEVDQAQLVIWLKKSDGCLEHKGFGALSNIDFSENGANGGDGYLDAATLAGMAAEGYTVERSATVDGGDGYYWIFTVKKKQE